MFGVLHCAIDEHHAVACDVRSRLDVVVLAAHVHVAVVALGTVPAQRAQQPEKKTGAAGEIWKACGSAQGRRRGAARDGGW